MKTLLFGIIASFLWMISPIEEEKITWQENLKLNWTDFKGIPNGADSYVASTNSGISFSFSLKESHKGTEVDYTVQCNFYPGLSWYRPERVSNYILAHEQTHFDISELFARKLRMKLSSIQDLSMFKIQAEKYYNEIEFERREMQRRYDEESDHSNLKQKEYAWREFVASELRVYQAWK